MRLGQGIGDWGGFGRRHASGKTILRTLREDCGDQLTEIVRHGVVKDAEGDVGVR